MKHYKNSTIDSVDNVTTRSSAQNHFQPEVIINDILLNHHLNKSNIHDRTHSNWEAHLFEEVNQLIFQMTRLPVDHDFHLDIDVAKKAADVLGSIRSNGSIEAPRVINEEGDAVLFTWDDGEFKRYLCIEDDGNITSRVRKPGTQFSATQTLSTNGNFDIPTLFSALGFSIDSGAAR